MITKILDKYYAQKLANELYRYFTIKYFLDVKIKTYPGVNEIFMKPTKYKDYTSVFYFEDEDAFIDILKIEEIKKLLENRIKELYETRTWE